MENNKYLINKRFQEAIDWIISNRKEKNKTLIANKLKISKSKFSEILNDRMNVSAELIADLYLNYNVNPEWLLTGQSEIYKSNEVIVEKKESTDYPIDRLLQRYEALIEENASLKLQLEEFQMSRPKMG